MGDVSFYWGDEELTNHREEFAAAFITKHNINPDEAVLVTQGYYPNQKHWFTKKSERELELQKRIERSPLEYAFNELNKAAQDPKTDLTTLILNCLDVIDTAKETLKG